MKALMEVCAHEKEKGPAGGSQRISNPLEREKEKGSAFASLSLNYRYIL